MYAIRLWARVLRRLSLSVVLLACCPTSAVDLSEDEIKAAYLYNFAKFTEWPAEALTLPGELRVCVLGSGPVNQAILALQDKKIGERTLTISTLHQDDAGFDRCQVLFVARSEQSRFLVTLKTLADKPILTLSDIDDFAEKGGAIALVYHDDKVRFEINLDTIRAAKLRLPSQLLNIATHVYGH